MLTHDQIFVEICHVLREREPQLFQGGEPWKPAGLDDLHRRIGDLVKAVQMQPDHEDATIPLTGVCGECDYQTSCGYCLHRDREACILQRHLNTILTVV